jgi:RNA polymerase sigma-70 factor (ECF subfamily)
MTAIVEDDDNKYRRQFDELFRRYGHTLHRMAHRIVGNDEDAEDALQTAFMKVMERPWPMELIKNPVGYLVTATKNAALDSVRMRSGRLAVSGLDDAMTPVPIKDSKIDDRIELMRLALAHMKPRYVETLILCCMEGLTCKELAAMYGKARGAVLKDLWLAKLQVRKLIGIQEKKDAQKNKRQSIPRPDMANPSTT